MLFIRNMLTVLHAVYLGCSLYKMYRDNKETKKASADSAPVHQEEEDRFF